MVSSSPNNGESSKDTAIGSGVGAPLGVIARCLVGFFFWRRKCNMKRNQTFELHNNERETVYGGAYGGGEGVGG